MIESIQKIILLPQHFPQFQFGLIVYAFQLNTNILGLYAIRCLFLKMWQWRKWEYFTQCFQSLTLCCSMKFLWIGLQLNSFRSTSITCTSLHVQLQHLFNLPAHSPACWLTMMLLVAGCSGSCSCFFFFYNKKACKSVCLYVINWKFWNVYLPSTTANANK